MKQVIVVNNSLKLPKGKLAAQVAHAAVASLLRTESDLSNQWLREGMPKVVLKVDDEQALLALRERAAAAGVSAELIRDAGRTVVAAGTITCLGLGPAATETLTALTAEYKLL
ncbi:aminoacyl-tRNA hydrolase [Exilibacterium tricleocarpae]|uniref:aminoacyl-tRNA hydrolase n=1 Tax=Exilibacterium tricleocarpae TaxID=2591008 RepID=UPI001C55294B|nr:aminoacyl-tRNA hydrolase [Exilibacterium tricleocarpae]